MSVCPDKSCQATGPEGCRYPNWMFCGHPVRIVDPVCTSCKGRTTIIDPISQEEEPYTCADCGGTGKAANQIHQEERQVEFAVERLTEAVGSRKSDIADAAGVWVNVGDLRRVLRKVADE